MVADVGRATAMLDGIMVDDDDDVKYDAIQKVDKTTTSILSIAELEEKELGEEASAGSEPSSLSKDERREGTEEEVT